MLISVFSSSRKAWRQGILAAVSTAVICCAVILWSKGLSPLAFLSLVPAAILLGIARLRAMMTAQEEHLRLLAILYSELEPHRFIEQYEPICNGKMSDECRRAMTAHLANGYAYGGDSPKALELISSLPMPQGKKELGTRLLIAGNRCTYHLLAQDAAAAREEHSEMVRLLEQAKAEKRKISPNYERTRQMNELQLNLLENKPVDVSILREELTSRSNRLHKALCRYLLAWSYAQAGKRTEARGVLKEVLCLKGSVILLQQARELDERLKAEK